jgi:hypothetical protein
MLRGFGRIRHLARLHPVRLDLPILIRSRAFRNHIFLKPTNSMLSSITRGASNYGPANFVILRGSFRVGARCESGGKAFRACDLWRARLKVHSNPFSLPTSSPMRFTHTRVQSGAALALADSEYQVFSRQSLVSEEEEDLCR